MANEVELEKVCKPSPTYVFSFTSRRYRQLADKGIVPKPQKGIIDLLRACRMLFEYQQVLIEGQGSRALIDARLENIKLKNDLLTMEKLRETGKLISREEMISDELGMAGIFKTALLSFHRSLPPILVGRDVREISAIMKKEVWNILNRLNRIRRKK